VKKGSQAPIIVTFDGPDDPSNPQNWPVRIFEQIKSDPSTNDALLTSSGRKSPPTP
jgi:hypothetical protein